MNTYGIAIKVDDKDNVGTIFSNDCKKGSTVEAQDKRGRRESLTLSDDIPYGHKIALRDLKKGDEIVKYGHVIGVASKDIQKGDYVHIHNLDALRGRGDL
jgi:altronate dehydratase small subunit